MNAVIIARLFIRLATIPQLFPDGFSFQTVHHAIPKIYDNRTKKTGPIKLGNEKYIRRDKCV
jgi:hypothetical protein